MSTKIAVIVLQYNNSATTIRCLDSLQGQTTTHGSWLMAIDNASEPAEREKLRKYCQSNGIDFIQNDQNFGYAGGNNVGIKKVLRQGSEQTPNNGVKWLIILNNDTTPPEGFLNALEAKLEPLEPSVVGLALAEGDRTAYAGQLRWLRPTLPHIHTQSAGGQSRITHGMSNSTQSTISDKRLARSLYAIGAAVAIHSEVFKQIGYLDERYFLYFEDADFSMRAKQSGLPVKFLDDINVGHDQGSSTKALGSPLLLYYHTTITYSSNELCYL